MMLNKPFHPKIIMTDRQRLYLKSHYSIFTIAQMSEDLGICKTMVGSWLAELGLKKEYIRGPKKVYNDYFFRHDKNLVTI